MRRPEWLNHVTGTLLAAIGCLLLFVGLVSGAVLGVGPGNLEYGTLLAGVSRVLESEPGGTFTVIRKQAPRGRGEWIDSIAAQADSGTVPSVSRFGFVDDEIRRFNRWQELRGLGVSSVENPTLLSVLRTAGGTLRPGTTITAAGRRLTSPFTSTYNGDIRARDWWEGAALIAPDVVVPLDQGSRLTVKDRGTDHLCEFDRVSAVQVNIYCASEERIPQAIFHFGPGPHDAGWVVAGYDRIWVDGRRLVRGDSARLGTGSTLMIEPLGPLMFGYGEKGVLADTRLRNGTPRRNVSMPSQSPASQLVQSLRVEGSEKSSGALRLALHGGITEQLQASLEQFVDGAGPPMIEEAMIIVVTVPSGEVIAVAGVRPGGFQDRVIFERIAPGSAVKPLLAAAVLSERPDAASLRIPARTGTVTSVLGMPDLPEGAGIASHLNCPIVGRGLIDLEYFLRCSNNEFAAGMLMLGLARSDARGRIGFVGAAGQGTFELGGVHRVGWRPDVAVRGGEVAREELLRSPVAVGMNSLFGLAVDPEIVRRAGSVPIHREPRVHLADGQAVVVGATGFEAQSQPALLAEAAPAGTPLAYLYRYAIGAWENRWSLAGLAEAFARVTTDRRVMLRLTQAAPSDSSPMPLGLGGMQWYPTFIRGLSGVAVSGTARGLAEAVLPRFPAGFALLSKTGTLAEAGSTASNDSDLYTKTFLMTVGRPNSSGAVDCGVTTGIYVRFSPRAGKSGPLPNRPVEYVRAHLGPALAGRWAGLGITACK